MMFRYVGMVNANRPQISSIFFADEYFFILLIFADKYFMIENLSHSQISHLRKWLVCFSVLSYNTPML